MMNAVLSDGRWAEQRTGNRNVVGVPIAAGVLHLVGGPLLNPMVAAAAMSLSSVSVLANALRLKWFRMSD